jgi:hypothetical protein
VPESYMLNSNQREIESFRKVLEEQNGKKYPWVHKPSNVNQGKGITIMAPNSPELLSLPAKSIRAIINRNINSDEEDSEGDDDEGSEEELEESMESKKIRCKDVLVCC